MVQQTVFTIKTNKLEAQGLSTEATYVERALIPVGNGWKPTFLYVHVDATQTFPGVSSLEITWGIGRVFGSDPDLSYQWDVVAPKIKLDWNGFTADWRLEGFTALDIPPNLEGAPDRYLIARVQYRTLLAGAGASATYNMRLDAVMVNPNTNPPPAPAWDVVLTDTNPNIRDPFFYIPYAIVGVIIVAGLFAVGFVGEKLGAGQILPGIAKAVGDGVNTVVRTLERLR